MFSLSFPLAQGMPWLFALALLPAAWLRGPRGFWWPARIAAGLGLALVLGAWLQAYVMPRIADEAAPETLAAEDAVVADVHVNQGDLVKHGQALISFKA